MRHMLLTVLGKNPQGACYILDGKQAECRLAPLSLFELLPEAERPDSVLALCTEAAKLVSLPILKNGLGGKADVRCVDVPDGTTQEEIHTFMSKASNAIMESGCRMLSVDVTHGFRHFSFLTYIVVLFVSALKKITVRAAYYGLRQENSVSPFIDLKPLLELPDWIHGVRVFDETGSAAGIASALRNGRETGFAKDAVRDLERVSRAYLSGLPLEVGCLVNQLLQERVKPLRKHIRKVHKLPLTDELVDGLGKILTRFALDGQKRYPGWKRNVHLTETELKRQAKLVDNLLDQNNISTALGLMREWIVSWVIWLQDGEDAEWLKFDRCRRSAERTLNSLRTAYDSREIAHMLSDEQRILAEFWKHLTSLRNAFHHHGMRLEELSEVLDSGQELKTVVENWKHFSSCPSVCLDFSSGATLLVSPIGKRPGVLFSAIQSCSADSGPPSCCAIICSSDTEKMIPEVLQKVEYNGDTIHLRLVDPHGGCQEVSKLASKALEQIARADRVLVNVTGGTTLMGLLAQQIADNAARLGRKVRRFGLIDRRTPEEQDADPYVVGEPFWFDETEGSKDEHRN